MTVQQIGIVAIEHHGQTDIQLSDFSDGKFRAGFWLEPNFRIHQVTLKNAQNMGGVRVEVGDGAQADRFGAVVVDAEAAVQDMDSPAGNRILAERIRPMLTVSNVDAEAARFGKFDVRIYGWFVR